MEIPYYLKPNEALQDPVFGVIDVTSNNPVNSIDYSKKSNGLWADLSGGIDKAGDYVWDSVSGAWVSVKSSVTDASKGFMDVLGDFLDSIKANLLIGIGLLLLIVWVVAKSGILKQAAAFV